MSVRKFQCMGKNRDGTRCKNKFLTSKHSDILVCSKHEGQEVDFRYSGVKAPSKMHDVAKLIAIHIKDPETFANFARVCLSCAKACHQLQTVKKSEFSIERDYYDVRLRFLPNGNIFL